MAVTCQRGADHHDAQIVRLRRGKQQVHAVAAHSRAKRSQKQPLRIRPVVQEQPDQRQVARERRQLEAALSPGANLRVRAAVEQQLRDLIRASSTGRDHQRGSPLAGSNVRLCLAVEERPRLVQIVGSVHQRCSPVFVLEIRIGAF